MGSLRLDRVEVPLPQSSFYISVAPVAPLVTCFIGEGTWVSHSTLCSPSSPPPVSYISYLFSILSTSVLVQTHLSYFSRLLSGRPVSNIVVIKSTLHISARHSISRLFWFAFYTLVTLDCLYCSSFLFLTAMFLIGTLLLSPHFL